MYKEAPVYPTWARVRGVMGWALVEFSIEENGGITEIILLDSSPKIIFDKASLEATKYFKYEFRGKSGTPKRVTGVTNMFYYALAR